MVTGRLSSAVDSCWLLYKKEPFKCAQDNFFRSIVAYIHAPEPLAVATVVCLREKVCPANDIKQQHCSYVEAYSRSPRSISMTRNLFRSVVQKLIGCLADIHVHIPK